ncbi:MAG: class I SAM-dependent methyltransferase [Deltaproteobacteria bacterium]|nr:class I SAM-dependent methyltransferase [Deltaproteobacteria bacterium]
MSAQPTAMLANEVPETRFGTWFQGTEIWRRYVVAETLAVLAELAPQRERFARVLDAGCGHGFALASLDERFAPEEIVALDADASVLARAATEAARCRAKVDVRTGDVAALAFVDGSIDLVLCHQTLHHTQRQQEALAELHRVLRPGGVLLLAESCRAFVRRLWVRALFRHAMHAQHGADEYVALVRDAGFELLAHATPDPWWSLRDLGARDWLLGRTARTSAEHTLVCIAARRPA